MPPRRAALYSNGRFLQASVAAQQTCRRLDANAVVDSCQPHGWVGPRFYAAQNDILGYRHNDKCPATGQFKTRFANSSLGAEDSGQISFFIIVSSSNLYAEHLGGTATFSGVVIGIPTLFSGICLIPLVRIDQGKRNL